MEIANRIREVADKER